jgi:hypothetical protein
MTVDLHPSLAQKEAGNYRKQHISFQGLPVSIENPKGTIRRGDGWQCRVPYDYGYIKGTEGADGDHVDVCIGSDRNSDRVYVIDQQDHRTKKFDEHKCMLGYHDRGSAERAYRAGFSDGKGHLRLGPVTEMSIDRFKWWLKNRPQKRPAHIDRALQVASKYDAIKSTP